MILLLNNDGPKGVKGATEEDKKEPNMPCKMGLTDLGPWADIRQAQLMKGSKGEEDFGRYVH